MRKERQVLQFVKLSGTQNDYIYFNCFDQHIDNPEGLAVMLSDRHLGIGGDGIVLIYPSDKADARMEIINQDGTYGGLSGNALRCIANIFTMRVSRKTIRYLSKRRQVSER